MTDYQSFLDTKRMRVASCGIEIQDSDINPVAFPFQRDIIRWAVRKGRAAIFVDTGLGKTVILAEWARLLGQRTLIIAPLSVARQTVRLVKSLLGWDIQYVRYGDEVQGNGIYITNYEMVEHFAPATFGAVVLDESGIIKAMSGHYRRLLTEMWKDTPYRLCCTATPAPNDHVELGTHAEFLGVCTEPEMRAMFFINANKEHTFYDGNGTAWRKKGSNKGGTEWRLRGHAEGPFFQWLASWAVSMTKPSDLGYDDDGFILPPLNIQTHFVHVDYVPAGQLMFTHLSGIQGRATIRKDTVTDKIAMLKSIVNGNDEQWIIWTGLDEESKQATAALDGAVEVKGSDSMDYKVNTLEAFQDGKFRVLVSKVKICGFGMNFQNASHMVFLGMNDSWEYFYQAVRREYRFGQTHPVNVHVIMTDIETEIWYNIQRKEAMANRLRRGLIENVRVYEKEELQMVQSVQSPVVGRIEQGKGWTAMLGDSCDILPGLPENSVDLSCYSPPFSSLFTYTDSPRDLGNSRDNAEFFGHYSFIIREVLRVTKPGRMTCVHTSDIPAMAERDGYIGLKDFPGDVIRAYEKEGWVFTGRAYVWKNPQIQAVRVKSKALLFAQLAKDSADCRPALVDQVLLFRKKGENAVPITPVRNGEMTNETWIEWAAGIWLGISETDTLQTTYDRGPEDDKHICPLQLGTIERCIKLYSNPGETVLSCFMGIGSECYQAVRFGRKAIGIELKENYFDLAVRNLRRIEAERGQPDLFTVSGVEV